MVIDEINSVDVGQIDFENGYVKDLKFELTKPTKDQIEFSFDSDNGGYHLQAHNVGGKFHGFVHYENWLMEADIGLDVSVNNAANLDMLILLSQTEIDGKQVPQVTFQRAELTMDTDKVDLHLSGSVLAEMADALIKLFKGRIISDICKAVSMSVAPAATEGFNSLLKESKGLFPTGFGNVTLDFSFVSKPIITNQ